MSGGLSKLEKIKTIERSLDSHEYFCENCLKILDKNGDLVPLRFRPAQKLINDELDAQRREMGFVRAIVLKSRRVGCSTLIASRYYRYTSLLEGKSTAIIAHLNQTTGALYDIVKRFQQHNPIAPKLGASNIRQLKFARSDSQYAVYSAENEEAGRGQGFQYLHGSEMAFWPKPQSLLDGIFKAVPLKEGTEIIIESTARGPMGKFYDMVQEAIAGEGVYKLIFVPWTMDPDCSIPAPDNFEPRNERPEEDCPSEVELMEQFGVTEDQLAWRRMEMGSERNIRAFMREFPLTVSDAFVATSELSLINPADVIRARKASLPEVGDVVVGVDPAGAGTDKFAIATRRGNVVTWVGTRTKVSVAEAVAWIKAVIKDNSPVAVYIDAGGGGNGSAICSLLADDPSVSRLIRPVNFGGRSQAKLARPDKPGPVNRRAEMYKRLADWLSSDVAVSIPDDEDLTRDFAMAKIKEMNNGDWRLESKKGQLSPDKGDAIALTFADRYAPKKEKLDDYGLPVPEGGVPRVIRPNNSWMI